jgi:hypothetical protein
MSQALASGMTLIKTTLPHLSGGQPLKAFILRWQMRTMTVISLEAMISLITHAQCLLSYYFCCYCIALQLPILMQCNGNSV